MPDLNRVFSVLREIVSLRYRRRCRRRTYDKGDDPVAGLDCAVPWREEVFEDCDDALAELGGEAFED